MAVETVRIMLLTDAVVPATIDGVVVRIFDADSLELVTMGVTGDDSPGSVVFELPGDADGLEYQARFFVRGGAIRPKRFLVYSPETNAPGDTNQFVIMGEAFTLEASDDPTMCLVQGYVTGPSGRKRPGVDLVVTPKFNAFVDQTSVALPGRFIVRSDRYGYVKFPLYRYGMYHVTVAGREEVERNIEVPDRSSILLPHLMFPVVISVVYAEAGPYTLRVGENLELTPTVKTTDFRNLGVAADDVRYSIVHPSIASVQPWGSKIVIRGIQPGATILRVTRLDNTVVSLPDLGISGADVPIVVTA